MTTLDRAIEDATAGPRFTAFLLGLLALVALIVAGVGTFSVLAWSVERRTREIGVRVALGATRGQVWQLVLGQAMRLTAAGGAAGLVLALLAGRGLASLLYAVSPRDPWTLGGSVILLAAIALGGGALAARRALRIDPARALRSESQRRPGPFSWVRCPIPQDSSAAGHRVPRDVASASPKACRAQEARMPAELFRQTAPPRRRVSLVPLSVAAHAVGLAALVIAPILADGELPDPVQPTPAYVVVKVPSLPPLGRQTAAHTSHTPAPTSSERAAPTEAPDHIEHEAPATDLFVGPDIPGLVGIDTGVPIGNPVADYVPPPPPPRTPVHVGGLIQQPKKIRDVPPRYPEIAQRARVQGMVIIEAVIGADGRVRETRVLQSVPLLDRAALDAVSQWVFSPTKLNGEAVPVVMTVTVDFRLQ